MRRCWFTWRWFTCAAAGKRNAASAALRIATFILLPILFVLSFPSSHAAFAAFTGLEPGPGGACCGRRKKKKNYLGNELPATCAESETKCKPRRALQPGPVSDMVFICHTCHKD